MGLPRREATYNDNRKNIIDEDAFIDGFWNDKKNGKYIRFGKFK